MIDYIRRHIHTSVVASGIACLALSAGCIKNDIPFPRIPQYILAIAADGEERPALISDADFSVTLYLSEDVDIRNVSFSEFRYSEDATASLDLLEGSYDLSSPIIETLTLYQPYQWVISAEQNIERYFRVEGQFGESQIDVTGHRIVVRMPDNAVLSKAQLLAVKLGPEGHTVYTPDIKPGTVDLSAPLRFTVSCWGRSEEWTVYTLRESLPVQTVSADAWSQVVWVYGSGNAGNGNTFEYRLESDEEWIRIPDEWLNVSQGNFSAAIRHLQPLSDYVIRAVCDAGPGNEILVRTEPTQELPDGDLEQWWKDGSMWNPWIEGGPRFWDTGNKGSSIAKVNVTEPSDYTPQGVSGRSAKLETVKAAVFGIGKLASGSLFTGEFLRVDGTNGVLAFGRPWNLRPTALRGFYQYDAAIIDEAKAPYADLKGRPDSCQIYIALTDWAEPREIRTNPSNRQLFDPNDPAIIAYGQITVSTHMTQYEDLYIPLVYRSTSRTPRYIQITASSSKYGDFFTGGVGSCLYLDQLSLDYDLPD